MASDDEELQLNTFNLISLIGVVQELFYGFGHDHVYSGLSNVSS